MARENRPNVILEPKFIDYFVEELPDGRGLTADILMLLGSIEKIGDGGCVISTHYSAPIMWYTATGLEGDNKVIELNLALQRGDEILRLKGNYMQTDKGIWRAIQKPASPLPQGFGPLSVESVMFERLLNRKNKYDKQNRAYSQVKK